MRAFPKTKAAFSLLLTAASAFARPPVAAPWDVKALERVPAVAWLDESKPVRELFYEGEEFQGKKTGVFAYYASPATLGTDKTPGKKFPAVVLVHGGGGVSRNLVASSWSGPPSG